MVPGAAATGMAETKLAQSPDDHVARSVWIASIAQLETARHKLLEGSFGPGAGEGSPALPA